MDLIALLQTITPIAADTEAEVRKLFTVDELPKGHKLHQQGHICNKFFYVEKGLLRTFYYSEEGKDITYRFNDENTFTSLIDSYYTQKPSFYNIELLEDSTIHSASFAEFEKLLGKHTELLIVYNYVLRNFLIQSNERITALQFQNAQERYHTFIEKKPNLLQRVSLGQVASYLGITQETLSRIRGK
jgi:CRP/FNR family transcriptional regulator, anaerobic regulatory protein